MAAHGVTARRSLGQHFVIDPDLLHMMVRTSGASRDGCVLEVGAGLGSLTLALNESGARIVAVEKDPACCKALRHQFMASNVQVVEGDIDRIDLEALLATSGTWKLVANLPYNIATPLILRLLSDFPSIVSMVVMVQLEVGQRLAAPPGSRQRGIPSVLVESLGTAEVVAHVGAECFYPQPKVESAVVRIRRHTAATPTASPELQAGVETLLRAAFGQRRKMLRRSLTRLVDAAAFVEAGVTPTWRPEALSLHQWQRLAQTLIDADPVRRV